jgi:hypothetical protein
LSVDFKTTKPILLDSLHITAAINILLLIHYMYIAAVICSESSNIGLVVLDFLLQANAMRNDQANIA